MLETRITLRYVISLYRLTSRYPFKRSFIVLQEISIDPPYKSFQALTLTCITLLTRAFFAFLDLDVFFLAGAVTYL